MWMGKSRDRLWSELGGSSWDAIVIGGGIIGASILRELARVGYRAALVEGRDFAWGASSRSTKAVHGGLRYLAQGKLKVTRDSVHARQRLLREASGLVQHLPSLGILYRGERPGRWLYGAVLGVYQLLAGQWTQRWVPAGAFCQSTVIHTRCPVTTLPFCGLMRSQGAPVLIL